jgi:dimethylglycine dehydrogenase
MDQHGYRFTPTRDIVAREVKAVTRSVGLMEVSGFNRYEIKGPGAGEFLDRMVCGAIPRSVGKVNLCYLLTEKGNILSEATIFKLGDDHYWYGSAAGAEWHDRDWLQRYMPESVSLVEMAASHTILVVAGPRSRELLQSVSPRCDWSAASFPWMHGRSMFVGHGEVMAMSVSFSGELAYELHVPSEQLYLVWKTLMEAGREFDLVQFGLYATESMRLEKGYRHWKADLIYEHNPMEARLDRFVRLDKGDFIGKEALLQQIARGPRKVFVSMVIDCDVAPAHGGDPLFLNDKQVGSVTSGDFGHRVQQNIAYGYIDPGASEIGTKLEIGILGERYSAEIVTPCLYDPDNKLVRS